jgi:hypothetical protein
MMATATSTTIRFRTVLERGGGELGNLLLSLLPHEAYTASRSFWTAYNKYIFSAPKGLIRAACYTPREKLVPSQTLYIAVRFLDENN